MSNRIEDLPDWLASIEPDGYTAPYWAALRNHRLTCQQCDRCGTFRFPPVPLCHVCNSFEVSWADLGSSGVVYSFTIVRHPATKAIAPYVPYVIVLVEFDEAPGARLVSNVVGCQPEAVFIGMRVNIDWYDQTDTVTVPRFRPAG